MGEAEEVPEEIEIAKNDLTFNADTRKLVLQIVEAETLKLDDESFANCEDGRWSPTADEVDEILEVNHSRTFHFQSDRTKLSLKSAIQQRTAEVDSQYQKKSTLCSAKSKGRRAEEIDEQIQGDLEQSISKKMRTTRPIEEVNEFNSEEEGITPKPGLRKSSKERALEFPQKQGFEWFVIEFDDKNSYARRVIQMQQDKINFPKGQSADKRLSNIASELRLPEERKAGDKRPSLQIAPLSPRLNQSLQLERIRAAMLEQKQEEQTEFRTLYVSLFALKLYNPFLEILSHQGASFLLTCGKVLKIAKNDILYSQGEMQELGQFQELIALFHHSGQMQSFHQKWSRWVCEEWGHSWRRMYNQQQAKAGAQERNSGYCDD